MLQGDFYTLTIQEATDNVLKGLVVLNAGHKIFEGHFPGHPVVPGVCMMQMIKEIITQITAKELTLQKAGHLKFLNMINPLEMSTISIELKYVDMEDNRIKVDAQFLNGTVIYFKFRGVFINN